MLLSSILALTACGANTNTVPGGDGIASGIAGVVSEAQFERWFPSRSTFYTYAALTSINDIYPDFVNSSDLALRKREAAAFLANISLETGDLVYVESQTRQAHCDLSRGYGCPAGPTAYFERGLLQLAWNYNYSDAGDALGYDLLNHPELIATDATLSAQTSGWFWNEASGPGGDGASAHHAMLNSNTSGGMGETIKHINGALECSSMGGSNTASRDARVAKYKFFCDQLGVSYGNNLGC
jgi:chitinase